MAKARVKPIHLIAIKYGYRCSATCDKCVIATPIEATILLPYGLKRSKGTFDPTKVTCQRCLKSEDYKTAMDKIKYPLLFWRETL